MTTTFDFTSPGSSGFVAPTTTDTIDPIATALVHNEQHVEEGINHLIEFFRHGPRNQALLTAVLEQVQEVEDAFWDLYTQRAVDVAVGAQLDILGRIVGELRNDRADDDYRAAVRTRILVNSSDGKAEQLIAIILSVTPSAITVLTEQYPGAVNVFLDTLGGATLRTLNTLLQQAKPAGVRLGLTAGAITIGAVDGTPAGGIIGAVDGTPAGFVISGGT